MSGFEIAGVVLGAFPIVYEVAGDLRTVFKDLKTWWRFETEFEDFLSAVEREHIAFSQNLEILLSPLGIDDEEKDALQNDPGTRLWFKTKIQVELRRAIQPRYYSWFMRELADINDALTGLRKVLSVGNVAKLPLGNQTSLELAMFRLKISFSHHKDKLISRIREKNEALYAFLDRSSQAASPPPRTILSGKIRSITALQQEAQALHRCMQLHWSCQCPHMHPFGVAVRQDAVKEGRVQPHIQLFLEDGAERIRVAIKAEVSRPVAAEIEVKPQQEVVSDIMNKLSIKNRWNKLRGKGTKAIQTLAVSAVSTASKPYDGKKTAAELEDASRQPKLGILRHYRNKSSAPTVTTPASQTTVRPTSSKARGVRFAGVQPLQSPQQCQSASPKVIKEFCSAIKARSLESCLGFLGPDEDTRFWIHLEPANQAELVGYRKENLDEFLRNTPRRETRVRVGYSTLITLLGLGPTPWMPPGWDKTSFFVLHEASAGAIPQPYISHIRASALLVRPRHPAERSAEARAALFAIGVLLLELVFGDALERQPWRTEYLNGNTGEANDATDLCTALRWQKRAEEEFGDGLADAIRRCILCAFDTPDLSSDVFVRSVWASVVHPVEAFLSAWSSGP